MKMQRTVFVFLYYIMHFLMLGQEVPSIYPTVARSLPTDFESHSPTLAPTEYSTPYKTEFPTTVPKVVTESSKVLSNNTCTLLGDVSRTPPVALSFCDMFRTDSCCDPAIDIEIKGYYDQLLQVSPLCSAQRTKAHIALQYIFCYACSPNEPKFTDNDAMTITLCSRIAEEADPINFDDCGLVIPGERGVLCAGDDVIIPGNYYGDGDKRARLTEFFNDVVGGVPPYYEDYTVIICDPSDAECESNCYAIDAGVAIEARNSVVVAIFSAALVSVMLTLI